MLASVGLLSSAVLAVLRHTLSMYRMIDIWYGEWSTLCSLPWRCWGVSSPASCLHTLGNCNLVLQSGTAMRYCSKVLHMHTLANTSPSP